MCLRTRQPRGRPCRIRQPRPAGVDRARTAGRPRGASPPADSAEGLETHPRRGGPRQAPGARRQANLRGQQAPQPEDQAVRDRTGERREPAQPADDRAAQHPARLGAGRKERRRQRRGPRLAPRTFDFEMPVAHWMSGPKLGIIDFRNAPPARARFAVMGASAALINFMLQLHGDEHGYTEVQPPFLADRDTLFGTGRCQVRAGPVKSAATGSLPDSDGRGAGHQPLSRRSLDGRLLPIKYTAYTPCFRTRPVPRPTCAVSSASTSSTRWSW